MAKSKSKKNNGDLFMALLYIVLGILFIVFRGGMLNWMMTIAGITSLTTAVTSVTTAMVSPVTVVVSMSVSSALSVT